MSHSKAEKIFKKWKIYLLNADKTISSVESNFDQLFCDMAHADIKKDTAEKYIKKASDEHAPTKGIAKWVWKRQDKDIAGPFDEYYSNWLKVIYTKAEKSFYGLYPLDEDEEEEAKSGNMSKQEYAKQRRYANSFPYLDIAAMPDYDVVSEDEDSLEVFLRG